MRAQETSQHITCATRTVAHVFGRRPRHFDPGLAEEGTGAKHEGNVEDSMDGVIGDAHDVLGRAEVVAEPADGV